MGWNGNDDNNNIQISWWWNENEMGWINDGNQDDTGDKITRWHKINLQ